jgi:tRNA pseudouridine(55) synthase
MIFKINKPYGITSSQFALELKRNEGYKNICFAGRLDPLACGTMLILTDEDVKSVSNYLSNDKIYSFKLILGISTISHDPMSDITKLQDMQEYKYIFNIKNNLEEFIKQYKTQEFPFVSSKTIKHNGVRKPLWWFYKNGVKREEIILPVKNITMYDYKLTDIKIMKCNELYNQFIDRISMITNDKLKSDLLIDKWIDVYKTMLEDDNMTFIQIDMTVSVSSGFYIRKFCEDFGNYINVPCIAFDITRDDIKMEAEKMDR